MLFADWPKQHFLNSSSEWEHLSCSEYTSREVYSGLCLFLSIVYSVFQQCPTRDEISFPVGQSNCKKRSKFSKISKFQNFIKFQKISKNSYKISKISKNLKIYIFFLNQNFHIISKLTKISSDFKIFIIFQNFNI